MNSFRSAHSLPSSPPDSKSEERWTAALKEHHQALRGFVASKLQGQGESATDDVLQEVAIAAHATDQDAIDPNRTLAWLRQVASHKVQDHWRSIGRQQRLRDEFSEKQAESLGTTVSPSEWVILLEQRTTVIAALKSMGPDDRAVLEQKYLHGRTYEDIAHTLGLSIKTLEYRLTRARQRMREQLEKSETTHPQRP